uniref:Conserved hypothetical plastid protein n=1 Tax=Bangiopsis subsimplex TaxID=139980 RepID=A0A1C9CCK4_9RHOD|nr:GCN5-like N-acetyltransferase [Bangiopsis subsimplex]AOM66128.1 GCN5-like N-acetyltransferase [Bangiopsis subsimplex]ARO90315.1 conserved hypothetical plastid protein [Bangiopsis subsimplex]
MYNWVHFFRFSRFNYLPTVKKFKSKKLITENQQFNNNKLFLVLEPDLNFKELENLCNAVGWIKRPIKKVKLAITNSFLTIGLYIENHQNMNLIGFVRVISDQTFNATIWDMVIHPNFQNQGLGKILMETTILELRYIEIDTITLFADFESIKFYQKLGFIIDPHNIKGMFWYPL